MFSVRTGNGLVLFVVRFTSSMLINSDDPLFMCNAPFTSRPSSVNTMVKVTDLGLERKAF